MSLKLDLLLTRGDVDESLIEEVLDPVGFSDWRGARARLLGLCTDEDRRKALSTALPMLLAALQDSGNPDSSVLNLERFVHSDPDPLSTLQFLADNPRAVEILVKLFVNSQFLTEILLRNSEYLERLTNHKRIADFKSREEFRTEAEEAIKQANDVIEKLEALRTFQHWELLRISACDNFGLLDLRSVTVQLSLLADAVVQTALTVISADLEVAVDDFVILAFGKLGGEELNYSSDIDLVFVSRDDASRYWELGQRLIRALTDSDSGSFLYRVDMRLRPWGTSGPLVTTADSYIEYLSTSGELWEKQALLKARPIAGNLSLGYEFIQQTDRFLFEAPVDEVRKNVRMMKGKIEAELKRKGRDFGEVKSGQGSIRDIEFVTQFLQLKHGRDTPHVRSIGTLDGLVRLADLDFIQANEFRQLSTAYILLRKIEHTLQLLHYKQIHSLPRDARELSYLARRLDFPGTDAFLESYRRHCTDVRSIYNRYIEDIRAEKRREDQRVQEDFAGESQPDHTSVMEPSYARTFSEIEIRQHAKLLKQVTLDTPIQLEAIAAPDGRITLTVCGFDQTGDLAITCGLLFANGFNIVSGNVFTANHVAGDPDSLHTELHTNDDRPKFVNVFLVDPPPGSDLSRNWQSLQDELTKLVQQVSDGRLREAQASLARRVAGMFEETPAASGPLLPIEIDIDNDLSDRFSVLNINAEDTPGFIYELANSLSVLGYDIHRVILKSVGDRAIDTLFIARPDGTKIIRPERQSQLRAAVVLVKHFTHLLPQSPNPETALLHFGQLLEQLFEQPDWSTELASLDRREVLEALTRLLGVSDFLWEDFLRLQHDNLFPVLRDVQGLSGRRRKPQLDVDLNSELADCPSRKEARARLNDFKDREMFRVDMRYIAGRIKEFGEFSGELTDIAEVVTARAVQLCYDSLVMKHGEPQLANCQPCRFAVMALGKAGGRELGFASDIELMFLYEGEGKTIGPSVTTTSEFYIHLVERFTKTIQARRKGIFEIDLRLRPYGSAGPLAVSLDSFDEYFDHDGPAWPYERQALVKMRPIAGNIEFGQRAIHVRDRIVYSGKPFDVNSMRAMRERQLRQLVKPGVWNAKLSPGGLVDCEYLVQALQITHGHGEPLLRKPRTIEAIEELNRHGLLSDTARNALLESYIFLRRLIDALRMVRGDARDLTVPASATEEFEYLARRLGYGSREDSLQQDINRHTDQVASLVESLLPAISPTQQS